MKPVYKLILAGEFSVMTLLLALCVPSHLVFQERCQLFLWTGAYFCGVCSVPGGFADWIGRFFTQFFISPWAGAAIIAALLVAFQRLILSFRKDTSLWLFSLSMLPVAVLCAFYANENAILSAVVALLLSLLAARAVLTSSRPTVRIAITLTALPFLYMALGPLCILLLVAVAVKDWKAALAGIPIFAMTVFAASFLFRYPLASLAGGVHYYRFLQTVRPEPWYALAVASLPLLLPVFIRREGRLLANAALAAAVLVVAFLLLRPALDSGRNPQKEETLRYALLAENEDWDGIIKAASIKAPSMSPVSVACLNLAMAKRGMLQENMFSGFQNGPQGLISDSKVDFISPLAMAQVYWALGLVDTAQRLVYEAQESLPDFQKSAYCYKWLARTNFANGDEAVARKYLEALSHTLFYRKWRPSDDFGELDSRRLTDRDMVSSNENIRDVLKMLVRKDACNSIAADYLLAYDMLSVDLDLFVSDYESLYGTASPACQTYADALALFWARDHLNFDGIPWTLPDGTADRCVAFFADRSSNRSRGTMKSRYGSSYWYYYFYHGK